MNQPFKDKLAKAVHRTISQAIQRGKSIDPIDLSERLLDSIEFVFDLEFEDSGIASIPAALRQDAPEEPAWDIRANDLSGRDLSGRTPTDKPDNRPHFLAPPPAAPAQAPTPKRVLVLPGDKEFNEPPPSPDAARPGLIRATQVRRRTPIRPGSNSPQKQYWTEAELIDAVDKATPAEIPFDIERVDGSPFRIVAKKNIINKQGLGGISLTYKDPRVGEGGNIPLMAQQPFSLYDEEIDVEAGLKSIVNQLVGIYKDRSGGVADPVAVGPEPDLARMVSQKHGVGEDAGYQMTSGNRSTQDPYVAKDRDQILQDALRAQRHGNDRLAGPGRRFDVPLK